MLLLAGLCGTVTIFAANLGLTYVTKQLLWPQVTSFTVGSMKTSIVLLEGLCWI